MSLPKGHNPNRPKPGSSIKVEPIRTKTAIENIKKILSDNLVPDLYLVFDLPVEAGRARQRAGGNEDDRLELAGNDFLEAVRAGYHELVESDGRAHLIDARGTADEVHTRVRAALRRDLPATFALLEE